MINNLLSALSKFTQCLVRMSTKFLSLDIATQSSPTCAIPKDSEAYYLWYYFVNEIRQYSSTDALLSTR